MNIKVDEIKHRDIHQDVDDFLSDYSNKNALRRLIRCFFAEGILNKNNLRFIEGNSREATLALQGGKGILKFDDISPSPANTYINNGNIYLIHSDGTSFPVTSHERLIDLLRDNFDFHPDESGISGLKKDVGNSIRNDTNARRYRCQWRAEVADAMQQDGQNAFTPWLRRQLSIRDAAMFLDQWGSLEGHPYYPTWKSRPGLSDEDVQQLSPEFNARVPLRITALRRDMAYVESMPHVDDFHSWFAQAFPALWQDWKQRLNQQGLDETQWLPLPIHSWHLENWVKSHYADEIAEGILLTDGPDLITLPGMSFRTVLPVEPPSSPFIKLPVAIWMTSEMRSLQAKSIHMGPRISTIIEAILAQEGGFEQRLAFFREETAFHYKHAIHQDDAPGKHLSVVFRDARIYERTDGALPVTVATLFTALPHRDQPLFTELVTLSGLGPEAWFRQYVRAVTRPVIAIYLLYGIGLEAHQQNSQILFSPEGVAQGLLIRDFGDGRTYAPLLRQRGHHLQPYVWPGILPTVFEDDIEPVRMFVVDACFVSHLHELALALSAEYGFADARLWQVMKEETAAAFDAVKSRVDGELWQTERDMFMTQPWYTRSLLRMHIQEYRDYRIQHGLSNPFLIEEEETRIGS
ncbi:IucA/IucC family protein [Pectobacterium brasiliense]|uniref:IucA/IucC family protein n=1 Tax=Pectobacterium brasiliense TaxID=180957 RepID=UPI00406C7710